MRHKTLIKEELREAIKPFRYLVGPNEWLNFEEMVQRIRMSESLSEPSARAAIMTLSGRDGIIREKDGEITFKLIFGGYILERAS